MSGHNSHEITIQLNFIMLYTRLNNSIILLLGRMLTNNKHRTLKNEEAAGVDIFGGNAVCGQCCCGGYVDGREMGDTSAIMIIRKQAAFDESLKSYFLNFLNFLKAKNKKNIFDN